MEDLCRIIEKIIETHPDDHVINIGNEKLTDINEFASLCYAVAGKALKTVHVYHHNNQRDYFCFREYEYCLDVTKQRKLIGNTRDLELGLRESFRWYVEHEKEVGRKNYIGFIESNEELGKQSRCCF